MRLGRVSFISSYIVDLDNPDMIQDARKAVYEDICNANKYDEMDHWIKVEDAPDANKEDIAEFLDRSSEQGSEYQEGMIDDMSVSDMAFFINEESKIYEGV